MKLDRLSKKQSGLVILIIYLFTMTVGIVTYVIGKSLSLSPITAMFVADVLMTLIIYFLGNLLNNASLYDPYWSVLPPFIILLWGIDTASIGLFHAILLLFVLIVWAVRLTYNWWINWQGFQKQDWRYDLLKEKNEKLYPLTNLMGIHMIPTIVVYFQLVVAYQIMTKASINAGYVIGAIIALIAPIIQFVADKQMYEFRFDKETKSSVINTGIWRFSRHPNYFGELLFWVAIYLMYLFGSGKFDLYVIAPIAMIALFVFISVPMMEKKLIDRPGYESYKKNVSMLIPFKPKKEE